MGSPVLWVLILSFLFSSLDCDPQRDSAQRLWWAKSSFITGKLTQVLFLLIVVAFGKISSGKDKYWSDWKKSMFYIYILWRKVSYFIHTLKIYFVWLWKGIDDLQGTEWKWHGWPSICMYILWPWIWCLKWNYIHIYTWLGRLLYPNSTLKIPFCRVKRKY